MQYNVFVSYVNFSPRLFIIGMVVHSMFMVMLPFRIATKDDFFLFFLSVFLSDWWRNELDINNAIFNINQLSTFCALYYQNMCAAYNIHCVCVYLGSRIPSRFRTVRKTMKIELYVHGMWR